MCLWRNWSTAQDLGPGLKRSKVLIFADCGTFLRLRGEWARGTSAFLLKYIHDGVVQLSEHHKVNRKAGAAILSGRVTREPGQCIVLLQNKPVRERERDWVMALENYGPALHAVFSKTFTWKISNQLCKSGICLTKLSFVRQYRFAGAKSIADSTKRC